MARGSSYGEKPAESSPGVTKSIPRRATRVIQALPVEEDEPETQVARPARSRRAPVTRDFSVPEQARPAKSRRASSAAPARVVPESITEEPHPLSRHRSWLKPWLFSLGVVLIGAMVLVAAGMYARGPANSPFVPYNGQSFPVEFGGSYDAFHLWNDSNGPIPSRTAIPKNPGPYSVLGKPTISAAFINRVLANYHSPTAGMGQSLYDLGVKYGIDPVYPLAFFMHESRFGTTGEATVTMSLGNSRCIPERACVNTAGTACQTGQSCYAKMNSWQDGFEEWYKLIRNLYVAQWGRVTVDQIIPKYAPNSDGNNEAEYIAALKRTVDTWRAGVVVIS